MEGLRGGGMEGWRGWREVIARRRLRLGMIDGRSVIMQSLKRAVIIIDWAIGQATWN